MTRPMTIAELHADEALRLREFPVATRGVFLAHAGVCPLPRRVADAMHGYLDASTLEDQYEAQHGDLVEETRAAAARLIGAKPSEVALVGPTSLALSYLAAGLPWRRGDNVVVYFDDYPSNVYPWMALSDRGVEVRMLNIRELGKVRAVDVQGQVDERTRVVTLASAHYLAGWRVNIDAIGRHLRSRGILLCVDAIQTLGAFPFSVQHVDLLAADAHKWMLGPSAAGLMYVKEDLQDRLRPIVHGWHNLECPRFLTQEELVFKKDARRYEAGTHNLPGLAGFKAALGLLAEVGMEAIGAELLRKRAWLVPELQSRGFTVLQPTAPPENTGGVVSFHKPGVDMTAVYRRLRTAGVTPSLRNLPGGEAVVRFSPHFYNTDAELRRTLDVLDAG
jgi:cysteine desulfurase/selenocysteine lyase